MTERACSDTRAGAEQSAAPLPWARPLLTRYGAVTEITAKVDTIGTNDGGFGTMRRT